MDEISKSPPNTAIKEFHSFFSTQLQRKALNLATSFEEKLCENHELLHWLVKELKVVRLWDDDAMTVLLPFVSIGNLKQF